MLEMPSVRSITPKIGMEIHVELATRTKMFTRCPSPAHALAGEPEPNSLIDPVVLALPGALPVLNREAIEMSIRVGLALGCRIPEWTRWDRKNYFYPDLPKAYQLSQYDHPVCAEGEVAWPIAEGGANKPIRITRAHLEEDAGKLLHEKPGGGKIDYSIVDLNRAGTPLLEIVTEPDFDSADECVRFSQLLRHVCRHLGVTLGVMQQGHMRFEPNINCSLAFDDGRTINTPITEVKNLNSFKALRGAIEYELREQPKRFLQDAREMGAGTKSTRGWDDTKLVTTLQREKEDAHDYRYFPDPDIPPVNVKASWVDSIRATVAALPHELVHEYQHSMGLAEKEAVALIDEPADTALFEQSLAAYTTSHNIPRVQGGKAIANLLLQTGRRLANEQGTTVRALGVTADQIAGIAHLKEQGKISSNGADQLFAALCASDESPQAAADRLGLAQVRDESALAEWCDAVIADPVNAKAIEDVRSGKMQAAGRLIGSVMQLSKGKADAKAVREMLIERINT
jgi:aspartyl-tRNA(Asn)/glutamyl-tRNA(Gln) amidotransferase subunit B